MAMSEQIEFEMGYPASGTDDLTRIRNTANHNASADGLLDAERCIALRMLG